MKQKTQALRSTTSTILAAVVTFALLMAYQFAEERKQLLNQYHAEALIVGANSSAALAFKDRQAAAEILATTRLTSHVLGAALYSADGKLFMVENASKDFPAQISAFNPNNPAEREPGSGLLSELIREDIFQDNTFVGSVVLHVSFSWLYGHMVEYAVSVLLIIAFGLFLARQFTAGLRRRMAQTETELEHLALYDRVTALPNRRLFEHELGNAVVRSRREGKSAALMYLNVDDFKKVNDLCGHQAGDEVLQMIAVRLKRTIRADDILARVGGDEFAVLLFAVGQPEHAVRIANQMIEALAPPFPTQPTPCHVGLSIGITMIPADSDEPVDLLHGASMAMYEAKANGKNRSQFFSEEINRRIRAQLDTEVALRKALKSTANGLWIAYQPQLCARSRQLVGVEALIRWKLDDGRNLSPAEFIPVAEKTGLIIELGSWLIRRICLDLAQLRAAGIEIPKVAVNVSPRELTRGRKIVEDICQTLREFDENVTRFQFEVTENALMDEHGSEVLDAFRVAGFALAIDDFGSGYSSLGYLKRFHVGTLKIDRQFIDLLPDDTENAAIVTAVIDMAKALGIRVVAEGVETESQAAFLTQRGCDTLQGFLLSRPIPPDELAAFVRRNLAMRDSN